MRQLLRRLHYSRDWLQQRPGRYLLRRLMTILRRYGWSARRMKRQVHRCVDALAAYECSPTFATPGRVVQAHPAFARSLIEKGVELAMHGYDHVDFSSLTDAHALQQFELAERAFREVGAREPGFRGPYLSQPSSLASIVEQVPIAYTSNRAIAWNVLPEAGGGKAASVVLASLETFYAAASADQCVATPTSIDGHVEIPVSVPDDLEVLDGLRLGPRQLGDVWLEMLELTYLRGELFVLLFHPESIPSSLPALERVLEQIRTLDPPVWITQLGAVSSWWNERGAARVTLVDSPEGQLVEVRASDRVTVLARGIGQPPEELEAGADGYFPITARELPLHEGEPLPFVGVDDGVPAAIAAFVREQGYLVERGELRDRCSVRLGVDSAGLSQRQILALIEGGDAPLVRVARWPCGARSAFCVTGDLDALSVWDYFGRLVHI